MNYLKSFVVVTAISVFSFAFVAVASATDIYLVYGGSDKASMKEIKKALPGDLKVKSYNVDMLAMADYSGKQKAVSKLSRAKVVVLINGKAQEALGEEGFPSKVDSNNGVSDVDNILSKVK